MLNQRIYNKPNYSIPTRVSNALRQAGIKRATRNWADYEAGKRIIASMGLNVKDYSSAVEVVARWVGV